MKHLKVDINTKNISLMKIINIILVTYSFVYVIWEFFYITFTIMKSGSIIAVVFLVLRLILRKMVIF